MPSTNKRKTLAKAARTAARKQAATHNEARRGLSASDEKGQPLANRPAVDAAANAFGEIAKTDSQQ